MKALVIGGTGPTGPYLINGLIAQGYDVSMMHRGTHDSDEIPVSVPRIIGDPHFRETLTKALAGRTFDLIIATYGRIRYVAEIAGDHCDRLITVGGAPCYRGMIQPELLTPVGMRIPLHEDAEKVPDIDEFRFGYLVRISEEAVMEGHAAGRYSATHFRYPSVYGPRQITPTIWALMRRFIDKRPHIVLPEGGLSISSRGYAENVAHAVLLAAQQPAAAGGQIYNCADNQQFTSAQWVEMIGQEMGGDIDIVGVPDAYAFPARSLMTFYGPADHKFFDIYKIKSELGYCDVVDPVEALVRSVRWYRNTPPTESDDFVRTLAEDYAMEDALAAIYHETCAKYSAIDHIVRDFHHPYPHPKNPGLDKDHRAR